jgi:pilus assembly protein Flp/PilA
VIPHASLSGKEIIMNPIKNFIREEDGVTAIEYGLIAALIAVGIVAGASAAGISLNGLMQRLADCMNTPDSATCLLVV